MEEQDPLSPSMHVPLRLLLPGFGGSDYSADRQLAVFTPPPPPPLLLHNSSSAITTSRFKLPEGWEVEEVPRANASRVDKYYYEPMTGHKFRSLREVERYVNDGVYTPRRHRSKTLKLGYHGYHGKRSNYRKMIISGGQMLRLDEEESNQYHMAIVPAKNSTFNSPYKLPDGWVVEEVPRNRGGCIDKNSSSWKTNIPREKVQSSTFNTPPLKINWVIASPGGDSWNPFIGGSLVPESVKQQWSKRFMLSMNDGKYEAPIF